MKYIANISCGKDSLAMVIRLMEEHKPLDIALMYDTGMEFQSIYNNVKKIQVEVETYGAKFVILKPNSDFLTDMLIKPIQHRNGTVSYGYEWCGRMCRWRTTEKISTIQKYLNSLNDEYIQYIGIAKDEMDRIKTDHNKNYPLVEWNMTENDCLQYCYEHGYNWNEDGIELYSVLDRVSCWCCWNKNLKELRNIRKYLPRYWQLLLGLQSRIDRPFKDNLNLFQLDERFKNEEVEKNETN